MVFRGLYCFCGAYQRCEAGDPVAYLAAQTDLGIVKRRRQSRERARLDKPWHQLNAGFARLVAGGWLVKDCL